VNHADTEKPEIDKLQTPLDFGDPYKIPNRVWKEAMRILAKSLGEAKRCSGEHPVAEGRVWSENATGGSSA
jgi:hypothetical protein